MLYFGAIGDRYGRKLMLLLGIGLSVPACLLAAFAWDDAVLVVARILGGLSAGMAYPTTLALITALWSGPQRTKSIALWSALGGGISALGPLTAGILLEHFWWGSVFLVTLPLAFIALVMAWKFVPAHVNESTEPVDNLGGILSSSWSPAWSWPSTSRRSPTRARSCWASARSRWPRWLAFLWRQRRAANPLYDLDIARRRRSGSPACAGIIVFGSLMGSAFICQQYLQNVLSYDTVDAGAAILPAVVFMVLVAPRSAKLVESHGSRVTLLVGYVFLFFAFVTMLLLWEEDSSYWQIGMAYAFIGIGVGFAGTPASHSLTGSVPVRRAGMASGTADLQRDLGGAIMQSVLGALLIAGYASAFSSAIASSPDSDKVSASVQSELTKSFSSAGGDREAVPEVLRPDHRRRQAVVPGRRRLGVHAQA